MTSYDRGNISPLEMSFRNLKERTDALLTALRQDYRQSLSGNVIYRHYSFGRLVWTLLLITAAAYLLTKPALCSDAVQRFAAAYETATAQSIHEFQEPILGLVKMILLLFTVSQIVTVFRYFYSKHIERGNRQVTAIEKTVEKRMQAMQSQSGFLEQAKRAALGNDADFKADTPNDLGEKLIALHERFTASGKTSVRIRKIFGSLLSAFYYLFGFFVIWQHWEELRKFSAVPLLLLTCFSAYTYFTIDIVLCNIGEYLGKLMRPFGCLLAAVYCGFLYYTVGSEYTAHPLQLQLSQGKTVLPVTTGQLMVLLQLIAMLTGVLTADYLGMRRHWREGFRLVLAYGENKQKTAGSVIRRGLWTIPWIIAAWVIGTQLKADLTLLLFACVWWRSMPLMKPSGSTLYTFFGRAKCISISLMSFALFIPYFILHNETITTEHLMLLAISFVIYLILGAIVKNRNDHTMFFDFMHAFL